MKQVTTRQVSPFQVEFPITKKVDGKKPVKFERTKDGALHFRPSALAFLTDDEYDFLLNDKTLRLKFVFQGDVKERPKKEAKALPTWVKKTQEPKKTKKKS